MNKIYYPALVVLVAVIVVSFFLPWVSVKSEAVGTFAKVLTGKNQAVLDEISGFRIPILANGDDARLMISIIKISNPKVENADKKSYLVWTVPLLALALLSGGAFFGKNKLFNLVMGIIGIAVFAAAVYKIQTTDMDKMVLKVTIVNGLWLTLYAYLAIGILGIAAFISSSLKKS